MNYKVLIVGLGNIAIGYDLFNEDQGCVKTHARAFDMHSSFSLRGGVDCNDKSRQLFEGNYHVPSYTDLDDALVDTNPDVVVVSTPTNLHFENIKTIIKYSSVKVILCEKPLSYDIEKAKEIVNLCKDKRIELYVNYIRRADSAVIKLKEYFDTEKISKPIKGVVWYSKGLVHNGSHFIDLFKFWFGSIYSIRIIDRGRDLSQEDIEPDFVLNFKGVSVVFLAAQEEFFSHYTIELISPDGRLRYDNGGNKIVWQSCSDDSYSSQARTLETNEIFIRSDLSNYQLNVVEQLERAIKGQHHVLCTGDQALELLNDIFSIIKKVEICVN